MRMPRIVIVALFLMAAAAPAAWAGSPRKVQFAVRGVPQTFYLYDAAASQPNVPVAIVVSGDGGWHGFIADVAGYLAGRGHPVVGVDAKEYLESLSKPKALEPAQVTGDFGAIARFAREQTGARTFVLAGWSEGAGLVVLGGLDPAERADLRGVVAIGLPELNELAWRWSDSVIYVTKKVPDEPTFNSKDFVGKLAPIPLMMIQSTHDDFVPLVTAREIFGRAQEPRQIVFIEARDHRFEGERPAFWQALDRALAWFEELATKRPR
jgi:dienelactone hydrolase